MPDAAKPGPLRGLRVVELAGLGPGPHACMILADLGADVIRVDRPGGQALDGGRRMLLNRGRPSVALDLKQPAAVDTLLRLIDKADVFIEGMRPGVAERLGVGPETCLARNPALVYGRMTGWGQEGPLASSAGHDMNYVSVAGALHGLGQDPARPHFPANLLGDFGGGSTYLVIGVLAALTERHRSGEGQVVDAAIVDGTAHLNALQAAFLGEAGYREERAANLLDGGAPFYDVYETADGRHMSVAALEPQFFALLVETLGLTDCPGQRETQRYPEMRQLFRQAFASRTQQEWTDRFEGTDACVAAVLPLSEAFRHPHLEARGTYVEKDGQVQPAPAPRFSRTSPGLTTPPALPGEDTREALVRWGIDDVDVLIEAGVAVQA